MFVFSVYNVYGFSLALNYIYINIIIIVFYIPFLRHFLFFFCGFFLRSFRNLFVTSKTQTRTSVYKKCFPIIWLTISSYVYNIKIYLYMYIICRFI